MRNVKQSKFIGFLKKLGDGFSAVMHPKGYVCIGCGTELKEEYHARSICPECEAELHYRTGDLCALCGKHIEAGHICSACADHPPLFDKAYAVFDYDGLARKLVISYKDGEKPWLAEYIAKYMKDYASAMEITSDMLCYVPSSEASILRRGFDHAAKLAKLFADYADITAIGALKRIKQRKDQTKLNANERFKEVADAFALNSAEAAKLVEGKRCLLIDDVLTTGATASACAKILKEAGAKSVTVLTFAR